jgi:hypothetical protein
MNDCLDNWNFGFLRIEKMSNFFFFFYTSGGKTQILALARQPFYYLSHI